MCLPVQYVFCSVFLLLTIHNSIGLSFLWQEVQHFIMMLVSGFKFLIMIGPAIPFVISLQKFIINNPMQGLRERKRALFVTSHPDDISMYFGPTILKLRDIYAIHLLCLSKGDRYIHGSIRKKELWNSCEVLGIPPSNITLMSLTSMPDRADSLWDCGTISNIVSDEIEKRSIDEVYTFDKGGVCGNNHHIDVFRGFAYMILKKKIPTNCQVYLLDTVNIIRKYSLFMDSFMILCPWSGITNSFTCTYTEYLCVKKAVGQHLTLNFLSRQLYMLTSRYMCTNTYTLLELENVSKEYELCDCSNDNLDAELDELLNSGFFIGGGDHLSDSEYIDDDEVNGSEGFVKNDSVSDVTLCTEDCDRELTQSSEDYDSDATESSEDIDNGDEVNSIKSFFVSDSDSEATQSSEDVASGA